MVNQLEEAYKIISRKVKIIKGKLPNGEQMMYLCVIIILFT